MSDPSNNALLIRSIVIAAALTLIKIGVFAATNSLTILGSAADSLMDLLVSAANYALLKSSLKPADDEHPYGHGKIESLAGLIQSLIIGAMVLGIGYISVQRLLYPEPIQQTGLGIGVALVALIATLWHSNNLKKQMLKGNSSIIHTEYLHYVTDSLMYVGVLLALGLTWFTGRTFWDPLISLFVVAYLVKNIWALFKVTMSELLDTSLPDEMLREIDQLVMGFHPNVVNYHDLRTRQVGPTKFIEFHVVIKNTESFYEAHELTEQLIDRIRQHFPHAIVTVHADPDGER